MHLGGEYGGLIQIGVDQITIVYAGGVRSEPADRRELIKKLEGGKGGEVVKGLVVRFTTQNTVKFTDGKNEHPSVIFKVSELITRLRAVEPSTTH